MEFPDYYQLLGITSSADNQNIRRAYHRLAHQYHPDLHPGDAQSEAMMKLLNEAVAVLSDDARRSAYDQRLRDRVAAGRTNPANAPERREGHDVEYRITITVAEACQGTRREVSFHRPDGKPYRIVIDIPPGAVHGMQLRLVGQGGPGLHGGRRGDLCVLVLVQ